MPFRPKNGPGFLPCAAISRRTDGFPWRTGRQLAACTTRIVHGAANVSWSVPLEEARRINVGGTAELLRLAEAAYRRGTLRAFDYLGTVMVAGQPQRFDWRGGVGRIRGVLEHL